jgi:hypothetical protein
VTEFLSVIELNPGVVMKYHALKKLCIFSICSIFCFLINASVSGAAMSDSESTEKNLSEANLKSLNGVLQERTIVPVVQSVVAARDMLASSFDVKVALTERFKAFLSLGRREITDLAGRDIRNNYNAVFGFQIPLK